MVFLGIRAQTGGNAVLDAAFWKAFFVLVVIGGITAWTLVLARQSRLVAQEETRRQTSLLMSEIRQLGGALGRPHPGAGALPMLDAEYLAFAGAISATPEMGAAGQADADAFAAALAPFGSGRQYLNFVEHAVDPSAAYDPVAWGRLVTIKSAYDPDGLIVAYHVSFDTELFLLEGADSLTDSSTDSSTDREVDA